jgi:hypothetical protein
MRVVRRVLVWACLLPLLSAHAADRYRVTLAGGEDGSAAVAKRLAAAYHGQLETPVDENGTFEITLSAATAELLARDPLVARLEAPPVAPDGSTSWSLGTYEYDDAETSGGSARAPLSTTAKAASRTRRAERRNCRS